MQLDLSLESPGPLGLPEVLGDILDIKTLAALQSLSISLKTYQEPDISDDDLDLLFLFFQSFVKIYLLELIDQLIEFVSPEQRDASMELIRQSQLFRSEQVGAGLAYLSQVTLSSSFLSLNPSTLSSYESLVRDLQAGNAPQLLTSSMNAVLRSLTDICKRLGDDRADHNFLAENFYAKLLKLPYEIIEQRYMSCCLLDLKDFKSALQTLRQVNPVRAFQLYHSRLKSDNNFHNNSILEQEMVDLLLELSPEQVRQTQVRGLGLLHDFIYELKEQGSDEDAQDASFLEEASLLVKIVAALKSPFELALLDFLVKRGLEFNVQRFLEYDLSIHKAYSGQEQGLNLLPQIQDFLESDRGQITDFLNSASFKEAFLAPDNTAFAQVIKQLLQRRWFAEGEQLNFQTLSVCLDSYFKQKNYYITQTFLLLLVRLFQSQRTPTKNRFLQLVFSRYTHSKNNAKIFRRIIVLLAQVSNERRHEFDRALHQYLGDIDENQVRSQALGVLDTGQAFSLKACLEELEHLIVDDDIKSLAKIESPDPIIDQLKEQGSKNLLYIHNLFQAGEKYFGKRTEVFRQLIDHALSTESAAETKHQAFQDLSSLTSEASGVALGFTTDYGAIVNASCNPSPTCLSIHSGDFRHCLIPQILEPDMGLLTLSDSNSQTLLARSSVQIVEMHDKEVLLLNPLYGEGDMEHYIGCFLQFLDLVHEQSPLDLFIGTFKDSLQRHCMNRDPHYANKFQHGVELSFRSHLMGYQWVDNCSVGLISTFPGHKPGSDGPHYEKWLLQGFYRQAKSPAVGNLNS